MEDSTKRAISNKLKSRISGIDVTHKFTIDDWVNKLENTKGICECCKINVGIYNLTIEHILPLSYAPKGFVYTIDDVCPLCISCNVANYKLEIIDKVLSRYGLKKGEYDPCKMSDLKTIKVDDEVHEMIAEVGLFGESFSDVIRRVFEKAKK